MQTFKCICCGNNIDSLWFESLNPDKPEQGAWNGGVVERLYMPYGSKYDGVSFVFGLCDTCIEEKLNQGLIGRNIKK